MTHFESPCIYCGEFTPNIGTHCGKPFCLEVHRRRGQKVMMLKADKAARVNMVAARTGNRHQRRARKAGGQ